MKAKVKVKVLLNSKVKEKIDWFVNNYEKEIGGWITGEFGDGYVLVDDILFPEQDVTSGSVDTSGSALIKLRKEYGDRCLRIIGHWHSHNTMGCFWSADDDKFIDEFCEPREKAVFIVSSSDGGHLVRIELKKPFKISLNEIGYKVNYVDTSLNEELQGIIDEKVKESKVVYGGYNNWEDARGNYSGYGYSGMHEERQATLDYLEREREDSEAEMKIRVKEKIDFKIHEDKVTIAIKELCSWEAEEIQRDFADLNPTREGSTDEPENRLIFNFPGKIEAVEFVKDIKKYLEGMYNDSTSEKEEDEDFVEF